MKIGVIGDAKEQKVDGHVWQADKKGIQASWLCRDPESGITEYQVAVGTTPGLGLSCQILDFVMFSTKSPE